MTATNNFLDILTSDPSHHELERIHEEAAAVFKTERDWTDYSLLPRLVLADSAIRETLRQSPLLSRGMVREVVPKDGIDFLDGRHLPRGTWVGIAVVRVHHDGRFYDKPNEYDAFRFARGQTVPTADESAGDISTDKLTASQKAQGFTTAGDTYLPWGYGRHAW